jgi:hypothetical protein
VRIISETQYSASTSLCYKPVMDSQYLAIFSVAVLGGVGRDFFKGSSFLMSFASDPISGRSMSRVHVIPDK